MKKQLLVGLLLISVVGGISAGFSKAGLAKRGEFEVTFTCMNRVKNLLICKELCKEQKSYTFHLGKKECCCSSY